MSWERDYNMNGRPYVSGYNLYKGAYEYGSYDEGDGKSFADVLRDEGFSVAEGVEVPGRQVTVDQLVTGGLLMHGPSLKTELTEAK